MNEIEQKWLSQLRKGYLEMCVMVALRQKQSSYGFALIQHFQQAGIEVNEGTLYPLLNRMHKNGWLESNWETPGGSGHPRRFYSLTKAGKGLVPQMLEIFEQHRESLTYLLEES